MCKEEEVLTVKHALVGAVGDGEDVRRHLVPPPVEFNICIFIP
jgi:hypothetical protein